MATDVRIPWTPLRTDLLAAWTGGEWNITPPPKVSGVRHDAREPMPGALYVALRGARFDGHDFVSQAVAAGAAAAMVARDWPGDAEGLALLRVDDPHAALCQAASARRETVPARIVGVTGSAGKTTVKEMLRSVMSGAGPAWATPGNWNNAVGLPLSLLAMPESTRHAVFEIGTSAPGEVRALCDILRVDAAIITCIGPAHLAQFGSLDAIAEEKADLARAVPPKGFLVLDNEGAYASYLAGQANCRVIRVTLRDAANGLGREPGEHLQALLEDSARGVLRVCSNTGEASRKLCCALPGAHNARNALLVVAAARELGIAWETIAAGLASVTMPGMRWEEVLADGIRVINDAYNANPLSMDCALETFAETSVTGRKALILGDMLELGDEAEAAHRTLGEQVARRAWWRTVFVGPLSGSSAEAAAIAGMPSESMCAVSEPDEAADWLRPQLRSGDAVLLKGSRGMLLERAAERLARPDPPLGDTSRKLEVASTHSHKLAYGAEVLVLGGGVSGLAAVRLLRQRGCRVTVADEASASDPRWSSADVFSDGVRLVCGAEELPEADWVLAVVSPGFEAGHRWLKNLRRRGVELISEIDLAAGAWPGHILAVTGSKGKSTIVKLCADALNSGGLRAVPCGNFGRPFSDLALDPDATGWAVLEVSSFQMELTAALRPNVAVLLNIQPDHLDRHRSLAAYRRAKLRLFANQRNGDLAVLPEGLRIGAAVPSGVRQVRFGRGRSASWRYARGRIRGARRAGVGCLIEIEGSLFDNPILGPAVAAAAAALHACGLDPNRIAAAIQNFAPLPHRMQLIATFDGVRFVNDSKATSLSALVAAVNMSPGKVRLIAGRRLKESFLDWTKEVLTERVGKAYLVGEAAEELYDVWRSVIDCEICATLDRAVPAAAAEAQPGETVLLSPGCASFDQFSNYEQRGLLFTELVRMLVSRNAGDQRRKEA